MTSLPPSPSPSRDTGLSDREAREWCGPASDNGTLLARPGFCDHNRPACSLHCYLSGSTCSRNRITTLIRCSQEHIRVEWVSKQNTNVPYRAAHTIRSSCMERGFDVDSGGPWRYLADLGHSLAVGDPYTEIPATWGGLVHGERRCGQSSL
jgi:hypothetical protein